MMRYQNFINNRTLIKGGGIFVKILFMVDPVVDIQPITEQDFQKKVAEKIVEANKPVPTTTSAEPAPSTVTTPIATTDPVTDPVSEPAPVVEQPKRVRKKITEVAKPFHQPASIVEPTTTTVIEELPDAAKKKILEFETKLTERDKQLAEARSVAEDEDVKILLEAKKNGKDIFGLLKEVQGIDPDTLTNAQLHEIDQRAKGIDGDDLVESLADFDVLKPYEQKARVAPIKEQLRREQSQKKSEFLTRMQANSADANAQAAIERDNQAKAWEKTTNEYSQICQSSIGKNHYGVVITPQMAESINSVLKEGLFGKNQDGSFNAQELFDLAFLKRFMIQNPLILETLENQFFAEGVEEIKKEVEVTDGASVQTVRSPQAMGSFKTTKELVDYTIGNARPVN